MPEEQYPKTNITIGSNGVVIEIQASDAISVKSEVDANTMTNLSVMWIANRLQTISLLQDQFHQMQQILQLVAARDGASPVQEAIDER